MTLLFQYFNKNWDPGHGNLRILEDQLDYFIAK